MKHQDAKAHPPTSWDTQPDKTWTCHKLGWLASGADLVRRPGLFLEDGNKTNFNYSHLGIGRGGARVAPKGAARFELEHMGRLD